MGELIECSDGQVRDVIDLQLQGLQALQSIKDTQRKKRQLIVAQTPEINIITAASWLNS